MASEDKYLVFGSRGYLGTKICAILREKGYSFVESSNRLQNRETIEKELLEVKPTHVLNVAGVTGRPNVDWCESNRQDTLLTNVVGTISLVDLCWRHNIHVTNYATGCIFQYDEAHPLGSGKGFTEEDMPNFKGSYYSLTKGYVEDMLKAYTNVLVLRIRMPISDDLHPRNFITKISRYEKVVDIPNSMTVLYDLLPISVDLAHRKRVGIYNFTNPGVISHNQILALYKKYMDPDFTWQNFTVEEQAKVIKADRSNNELDASKLKKEYPDLLPIQESIHGVFQRMKVNEEKNPSTKQ
mmetsp:Transcript_4073/g.11396  ORF Transcript_4073/g.11396 Transcript_4073/m.11396 type:complete len:297 (-) Transcript_4073:30-920(-)